MRSSARWLVLLAALACAAPKDNPNPDPPKVAASLSRSLGAPTLDTTGLRCILHSAKDVATVDSCAAITVAVVPPAPPPAPPPPAPVPPPPPPAPAPAPPPPPPVSDTVVASVKVTPNPVTLATGKSFQLTGGAYNASGVLVPNAGNWLSGNGAIVTVDASGKITGVGLGTANVEFHYGSKVAWSTVTDTGSAVVPPVSTTGTKLNLVATPADALVDAVAVCTKFSYIDRDVYGDANGARTIAQLKALGVRWIRDGVDAADNGKATMLVSYFAKARATGVKMIAVAQPNATDKLGGPYSSPSSLSAARTAFGDANLIVEGPNEVDNQYGYWGAGSTSWTLIGKNAQPFATYLRGIWPGRLYSLTVTSQGAAQGVGDLSNHADAVSIHPYPGSGMPSAAINGGVQSMSALNAGRKPWTVTETGYTSAYAASGGVDEATQAKLETRLIFEFLNAGVEKIALYNFVDWLGADPSHANIEANFGIVRYDGTPKPAYTALQNVLAIYSDSGGTQPRTLAFAPTVTAVSTVHYRASVKKDGTILLAMWNEVPSWNAGAKSALSVPSVPVKVQLAAAPKSIKFYTPVSSASGVALPASQTMTLNVPDAPVVLAITP